MTYTFKALPELGWAIAVAVVVFGAQVLIDFDPDIIEDWETWVKGLGAGAVRAGAAALIAFRK